MLRIILDLLYVIAFAATIPWLCWQSFRTGKYREGWSAKLLGRVPVREGNQPCVWFHAVSVGEVLLLRQVIARLRACRPEVSIVLSTTTQTGMEVARSQYPDITAFYFPLDFSWAVSSALRRVRPTVVALAELELWPNFIRAASGRNVRIALINGRMSPNSARRYAKVRWIMSALFNRLDCLAVQNELYRERFEQAGAASEQITVTGSVKYDGLETDRNNEKTSALLHDFNLAGELVWVAGSTSDPEERMVLEIFRQLRQSHRQLRLILVPRHKERFEIVANLIKDYGFELRRRSNPNAPDEQAGSSTVILVDTLGELGAVWGLADIAFVGGSFAPRGGQNMIEPAAYGAAVVVGPGTWNFQKTVADLLARDGLVQVPTDALLKVVIAQLVRDPGARETLGKAARSFVSSQSGAAARTVAQIERLIPRPPVEARSAA